METLVKRKSLSPTKGNLGLIPSVSNFFPSVSSFFDDVLSRDVFDWNERNFAGLGGNLPSVNLKETDTKIEIEMAAPGMKKDDFKVEIDDNILVISSEKEEKNEVSDKTHDYIRKEFSYQSFRRTFGLPDTVDENKIEANYKDGILHVTVAKKESSKKKPSRIIAIK